MLVERKDSRSTSGEDSGMMEIGTEQKRTIYLPIPFPRPSMLFVKIKRISQATQVCLPPFHVQYYLDPPIAPHALSHTIKSQATAYR